MKLGTIVIGALALVLATTPVATAEDVQNQRFNATLVFAEGGSFDETTGASSYVAFEAVQRTGEEPELFVHGFSRAPLDCFDGASDVTSFSAQGPATLDVSGRFATATVAATLDAVVDRFNDCTEESSASVEPDVTYAADLTADGPVLRERKFDTAHTPSVNEFHQQAHSVGRRAGGSLTVGDDAVDVFGAFIGKTYGTFHIRPALEGLTGLAKAADALNEDTRIRLAELGWAEEGETTYHDRFVGVFQDRSSETLVRVGGVDSVFDPDAECGVTTFLEGEGPGRTRFGAHLSSVTGSGTVDLFVATVDECTGEVVESTLTDVPVTFSADAAGPVFTQQHVQTILIPSEYHLNQRTQLASRDGAGTFSIGGTGYDPAFASIGRARMRTFERTA